MFSIVPDFNLKEWERSLEEVLLMDFETSVFLNDKCKYFMVFVPGLSFLTASGRTVWWAASRTWWKNFRFATSQTP